MNQKITNDVKNSITIEIDIGASLREARSALKFISISIYLVVIALIVFATMSLLNVVHWSAWLPGIVTFVGLFWVLMIQKAKIFNAIKRADRYLR